MAAPQYQPPAPQNPYYNQPPQPQYAPQQQLQHQTSNNNVVVVQQQASPAVVQVQKEKPSHLLHCIITLLCWPWIFVWLIMCCIYGC